MVKVNINVEILNVIHVVKNYNRFLSSYHVHYLNNLQFDLHGETQKFYNSLKLPEGLSTSNYCFHAVLNFSDNLLEELNNVSKENLEAYSLEY